ncbi:MAG: gamma-glutamyl-gamma-aminobutyrate hydrolase family protein [Vicinamibacteria bacterium]|nr:gamma-glutamyl-gamma-aminobutyrate hydrolase family protein [Vicinamibacteria bacterium]
MAIVALTTCSRLTDYETSIAMAGATVRPLDPRMAAADSAIDGVDALVLTGGADVDPRFYGERPHATFLAAEAGRDLFELALARAAIDRGLPLLAICRGVQVLNVAAGGSLVQDIGAEVHGALVHQVDTTPSTIAHEVLVASGSMLATLMADRLEGDALMVNSRHHQAVKQLAPGFVASATAPDGVIEAIELADLPFCVGVQWHPENFWRTGEFRALFEGLLRVAG